MQQFIGKLLNWRKNKKVIHSGKLMHFVPENGIYTYFRYNDDETVMIILNKNINSETLQTSRFSEVMKGKLSGIDIISSSNFADISEIQIPAKSAMIIELR
jgi:neopullulanase